MSALAVAAVSYVLAVGNTYDKQKFNAGSQPYTPMRIVNCPLNEYGRPAKCSVTTKSLRLEREAALQQMPLLPPESSEHQ